jgi:hypothetical protein
MWFQMTQLFYGDDIPFLVLDRKGGCRYSDPGKVINRYNFVFD